MKKMKASKVKDTATLVIMHEMKRGVLFRIRHHYSSRKYMTLTLMLILTFDRDLLITLMLLKEALYVEKMILLTSHDSKTLHRMSKRRQHFATNQNSLLPVQKLWIKE